MPGKPSYLLKLRHADLVIVVGLEMEAGWLTGRHHVPSAIRQSGNARIQPGTPGYFDASQHAEILDVPTPPLVRDIHPGGNPHYWLDPGNGHKIAAALTDKMSELRPEILDISRTASANWHAQGVRRGSVEQGDTTV